MSDEDELDQLKSNAENLSKCLHAMVEKIESIERKQGKEADADSNKVSDKRKLQ